MNIILLSLTLLFSLTGCIGAKDASSPNSGLTPVSGVQGFTTLDGFDLAPDTLSLFFIPEEINWSRPYYDKLVSPTYSDLRSKCYEIVVRNNDINDALDTEAYNLLIETQELEKEYDEKDCLFGPDPADQDRCDWIDNRNTEIAMRQIQIPGLKEVHIGKIVEALDADVDNPENYLIAFDDRQKSKINLTPEKLEIKLKRVGIHKVDYALKDGDIENLNIDIDAGLVSFDILEKTLKDGEIVRSGNIMRLDLSLSNFIMKARMAGSLELISPTGEVLRTGRAKIDLKPTGF